MYGSLGVRQESSSWRRSWEPCMANTSETGVTFVSLIQELGESILGHRGKPLPPHLSREGHLVLLLKDIFSAPYPPWSLSQVLGKCQSTTI